MTVFKPFVSVVTPVYNGERYLEECIESVRRQTFDNWEYLIVNNCSTDSTPALARRYAALDQRIRVYDCDEFLDVIGSYNRAVRLISPESKYCKVLAADDYMFPECLSRMVEVGEENPSVGVVGSYALSGGGASWRVKFDGLPYWRTVVAGHEACRWHLLGGHHFVGTPSSVLYRSDLVRERPNFYPNSRQHADISAFYVCLRDNDLGFLHHVLTFERMHGDALSIEARRLSTYFGSHLLDVYEYGPWYLTKEESDNRLRNLLRQYYRLLATGLVNLEGRRFWQYHRGILAECGATFYGKVALASLGKIADLALNPKLTFEKILRRRGRNGVTAEVRGGCLFGPGISI